MTWGAVRYFYSQGVMRVISVAHKGEFRLRLWFADGSIKDIDLTNSLSSQSYEHLRNVEAFRQVGIDEHLGTMAWPAGPSIDSAWLHANGTTAQTDESPPARPTVRSSYVARRSWRSPNLGHRAIAVLLATIPGTAVGMAADSDARAVAETYSHEQLKQYTFDATMSGVVDTWLLVILALALVVLMVEGIAWVVARLIRA